MTELVEVGGLQESAWLEILQWQQEREGRG